MSKLNFQSTVPEIGMKPVSAINLQDVDTSGTIRALEGLNNAFTETAKTRTKNDTIQYINDKTSEFMKANRESRNYSPENFEDFKTNLSEEVKENFGGVYADTTDWVNKTLDKSLKDAETAYGVESATNFFNDSMVDIKTKINDGADLSLVKSSSEATISNINALYEVGYINASQLEAMTKNTHWEVLEYGFGQALDKELDGVVYREDALKIVEKYKKMNSTQIKEFGGRGDEDISKLANAYGGYARGLKKRGSDDLRANLTGNTTIDRMYGAEVMEKYRNGDPDERKGAEEILKLANERYKMENVDGDSIGLLMKDGKMPYDMRDGNQYNTMVANHLSEMGFNADPDAEPYDNFANYMEEVIDADNNIRRVDKISLYPKDSANYYALMGTLSEMSQKEKVAFAYEMAEGKKNIYGKPTNNHAVKDQMSDPYMKAIMFNSVAQAGGFDKGAFTLFDPNNKTDTLAIDRSLDQTKGMTSAQMDALVLEQGYDPKTFLRDAYEDGIGDIMQSVRAMGGEHAKYINTMKPTVDKILKSAGATGTLDEAKQTVKDLLNENYPTIEFDGRTMVLNKNRLGAGGVGKIDERAVKNLYSEGIKSGKYYYKTSEGNVPINNPTQFTIRNNGADEVDYWTLRNDPRTPVYMLDDNGNEVQMISNILDDQRRVNDIRRSSKNNTYLNRLKERGEL